MLEKAQQLLDSGMSKSAVAVELGIPRDTFRRAVWDGRLRDYQAPAPSVATDKSERSVQDAQAADEMGTACTRDGERMLAAPFTDLSTPSIISICEYWLAARRHDS